MLQNISLNNFIISNSTFYNNTGTYYEVSIYLEYMNNVIIKESRFLGPEYVDDNYVVDDDDKFLPGGIFVKDIDGLDISSSIFKYNKGYALKCYKHCDNAWIHDLTFESNKGIATIFYEKSVNVTI